MSLKDEALCQNYPVVDTFDWTKSKDYEAQSKELEEQKSLQKKIY